MWNILVLLGVLALVTVGRALWIPIVARVFAGSIGKEAPSRQPDQIRLEPADQHAWTNPRAASALAEPFLSLGFKDAGSFRIAEMPGVIVRLLVKPEESFCATVYEHAKAGSWFDLVSRYRDDTSHSYSTARPSGLDERPGHTSVNRPGASPQAIYTAARSERPSGMLEPITVQSAARDFEYAYADAIAWRKGRGLSADEVARAATRKAA